MGLMGSNPMKRMLLSATKDSRLHTRTAVPTVQTAGLTKTMLQKNVRNETREFHSNLVLGSYGCDKYESRISEPSNPFITHEPTQALLIIIPIQHTRCKRIEEENVHFDGFRDVQHLVCP